MTDPKEMRLLQQRTNEEMKDEMKNRISMALKDPILQQGFEIICKENVELKHNKKTVVHLANCLEEKMKERIADLEKENAELKKKCYKKAVKDYCKLERENAELKKRLVSARAEFQRQYTDKQYWEQKANRLTTEWGKTLDQLTRAKNLIENIIRVTWGEGWNYSLDWKVKAEQFLGVEPIDKEKDAWQKYYDFGR